MKKAGVIAVSVAAASSAALHSKLPSDSHEGSKRKEMGSGSREGGEVEKFAPRFDGLRFIETLVTAHR
ncbi:uncharacterized protein A4U43_C01F21060 [Asparagus officinalis]|uniref:Uncharacterized protein n=1 Tax=Asparagus officinalis TaxID=4686 RepID=A0A5P1FTH5_ASPOF|nr:uncharacterized protein A4U43_C01F21060 [Asparagus officinalis]